MAKKVRVVNSCMVPPALPTPSEPIWLSNLDLFAAQHHVPILFFFRNNPSHPLPSPAASIKDSLARILLPYYPLAGRIGNSPDGRLEIKCSAEGALFVEAVSDYTLDEFGIHTSSLENCRLLVPTGTANSPTTLVQLTTLKCGSLCLAIALNHQATDGIAGLRFICNWAAATRDPIQPISATPSFDHTFLRARSPPSVQYPHPEFDLREPPEKQIPLSFVCLHLTQVQLGAIKALAGGKYSTFESLAAHIWRCACLARGSGRPDEERRFMMSGDMRRRVSHLFPNEFVGNAILFTVAIAPLKDVVAEALPVAIIREAIEKLDAEEYLQSAIDFLEMQEDIRRLSRALRNFAATDVSVTIWSKLPFYEVDFGWGAADFIERTPYAYPGQFFVHPSVDGGMKIGCSLEAEKMEGFVKLFHDLLPAAAGTDSDVKKCA